jgi:hypothetical protein
MPDLSQTYVPVMKCLSEAVHKHIAMVSFQCSKPQYPVDVEIGKISFWVLFWGGSQLPDTSIATSRKQLIVLVVGRRV